MLKIKPITLEGNQTILRPPSLKDVKGLSLAAQDGEIWKTRFAYFPHPNDVKIP